MGKIAVSHIDVFEFAELYFFIHINVYFLVMMLNKHDICISGGAAVFFSSKLTFLFLPEIWDALRAAADSDLALAQTIVDSAGIIVSNSDMTLCYDERGILYMIFFLYFLFCISFYVIW